MEFAVSDREQDVIRRHSFTSVSGRGRAWMLSPWEPTRASDVRCLGLSTGKGRLAGVPVAAAGVFLWEQDEGIGISRSWTVNETVERGCSSLEPWVGDSGQGEGIGIRRPWNVDRPGPPWPGAHRRSRCASPHRLSAALRPTVACDPFSGRSLSGPGWRRCAVKTNAPVP